MPLFDFQCTECEATFEELVKSAESCGDVQCAHCGSKKVERLPPIFQTGAARSSGSRGSPALPSRRKGASGCGGGSCGCHS
jgi:putative FmdB family regulatory protein